MDKSKKSNKKSTNHVERNRGGPRHTQKQKAEIVMWINNMYADGADMRSACEARSVSVKTYWVWRNETEELKKHYQDAQDERHAVRFERLRETGYAGLETLIKEHKRTRIVREGVNERKVENGVETDVFKPKKVTVYEEHYFPNVTAIRMILAATDPELFGKAGSDNEISVTFTQNAKSRFLDDEPDES